MKKIMLSKETFCSAIKNIQFQREKMSKFNDALDEICDGFVVFDSNNKYLEALLDVLKECMNDKDEFIDWYLFEDVEKVVTANDGDTDACLPAIYF